MNKKYIITFLSAFGLTLLLLMGVFYGAGLFSDGDTALPIHTTTTGNSSDIETTTAPTEDEKGDKVINVLAFGLNDGLADTIVLFSYNYGTNALRVLSIPRDTYFEVEGYNELWQHKINSVYTYREDGGELGMKTQISKLLEIPVHYYVKVEFSSVIAIVDSLGGYDVYLPYPMYYDDPTDYPPLHIALDAGWHHLDGLETLKYLRFRKSNDGTIAEGDVQRIERQKEFIKAMIDKALANDIVPVLTTIVKGEYVTTDMPLEEVLKYAAKIKNMPMDRVKFYTLEGNHDMYGGLSFWFHDDAKKKALMRLFYSTDPNEGFKEEEATSEAAE